MAFSKALSDPDAAAFLGHVKWTNDISSGGPNELSSSSSASSRLSSKEKLLLARGGPGRLLNETSSVLFSEMLLSELATSVASESCVSGLLCAFLFTPDSSRFILSILVSSVLSSSSVFLGV